MSYCNDLDANDGTADILLVSLLGTDLTAFLRWGSLIGGLWSHEIMGYV